MANLLTKEVGASKFSILDALMIAGTKIVAENLLARVSFVGNSTVKSGAIKIGGAFTSGMLIKNKFGMILGTALMVDGAEDIVRGVFGAKLGSGAGSAVVGGNNSNQGAGSTAVI